MAVLPFASRTVQVTELVPTGKLAGALLVTLTTPQLSLVAGACRFTLVAAHNPGDALTVKAPWQVIVGGCESLTITVWTQVAELPAASLAVQVTRLVPTGKLGGASNVTVATPQLSLPTGAPRLTLVATHRPGDTFTVKSAGQVIVGG